MSHPSTSRTGHLQVLAELDAMHTPIYKTWRLNERMYGARSPPCPPPSDTPEMARDDAR